MQHQKAVSANTAKMVTSKTLAQAVRHSLDDPTLILHCEYIKHIRFGYTNKHRWLYAYPRIWIAASYSYWLKRLYSQA